MPKRQNGPEKKYFCFQFLFFLAPFIRLPSLPPRFTYIRKELEKNSNENPKQKHTKWRLKNITHPTVKKSLSVGGIFRPLNPTFSLPFSPFPPRVFFYFVALLLSISHFQGATLDIYINSIAALDIVRGGFIWAYVVGKAPNESRRHAQLLELKIIQKFFFECFPGFYRDFQLIYIL